MSPPAPPAPAAAPPLRRRLAFRLGAVAVGLGLALLVLEAGLRLAGYRFDVGRRRTRVVRASPVPHLGYELIPGAEGHAWLTPVRINSLGLRGPEPAPPGARRRVAILGDSVGFGLFVAEEQALAAQLQGRLGAGVEVLNFSVTGYDTVQQLAQLEAKVLPLAPDALVLAYCLNDVGIGDEHMGARDLADRLHNLGPRWSRAHHFLVHTLEVAAIVGNFLYVNQADRFADRYRAWIDPVDLADPALAPWLSAARTRHPVIADWYTQAPRLGRLRRCFRELAAAAEAAGVPLLVAVFPLLEVDGEGGYPYAAVHRLVAAEAARAGLEVADLTGPFLAAGMAGLRAYPVDTIHPGPAGHAAAAAALAPRVSSLLAGRGRDSSGP